MWGALSLISRTKNSEIILWYPEDNVFPDNAFPIENNEIIGSVPVF